jgi:hypothetical protein
MMLTAALLLASCRAAPAGQPAAANAPPRPDNAGYSLLYGLLSKQQEVDKALWLHKVDPAVAAVIKEIAQASGQARAQLEAFARADPGLQLKTQPLPKIELATRAAIQSTETGVLLTSTGDAFRLRLLLTQTSAMEYASHLAQVLARNENNKARQQYLEALSQKLNALNDKVIHVLTLTPPAG